MSLFDKLDPKAIAALVAGGERFAEWLWHHVTGDKDSESAKDAIGKLKDKLVDAAMIEGLAQLQRLVDAGEFRLATSELVLATEKLRAAIAQAEHSPTIPRLEGLDMEIVAPGTLADELALPPSTAPELQSTDDEVTKP